MNAPLRESRVVRLDQIVGVSDLNPRVVGENDVAELAASILALGQLQDLMVELDGASGDYLILDGQRRWLAMKLLVERGDWSPDALVSVSLAMSEDDDAARLEQALAANTMRRALHPVDEHEAFAGLAAAGASEERIARDFGLDVRRVRQRLALGKLSPRVRAAWRASEIGEDQARAYAAGATHAAQDAVLDALAGSHEAQLSYVIRRRLLADAISPGAAAAVYLGEAAYRAAGGRVEQDLFDDEARWLDGALAKRLVREKLMAEAEKIAEAEGWGYVVHSSERGDGAYVLEDDELEFTHAEQERLDYIDDTINIAAAGEPQPELMAEDEAIRLKALLRMIHQPERASLQIVADLSADGRPVFDRGWRETPTEVNRQQGSGASGGKRPEKGAAAAVDLAAAPESKADKPGKGLRQVLDVALDEAFAASVRDRPDLALMVAVAKLGPTYGGGAADCVTLTGGPPPCKECESVLLRAIAGFGFDKALRACAAAPLADLTSAFCEIVAASIRTADPRGLEPLSRVAPLAEALAARAAPIAERLDAALDREAYFAAAPKAACLAAAEAIGAAGIEKGAKKPVLAAQVAAAATAAKWLPEPLATWARLQPTSPEAPKPEPTPDARSTAQAMAEAIDADEEAWREQVMRVCDFEHGATSFGEFLLAHASFAPEAAIKASELRDGYLFAFPDAPELSVKEITPILAGLGITTRRRKDGTYYLGVGKRPKLDDAIAAAEAAQ